MAQQQGRHEVARAIESSGVIAVVNTMVPAHLPALTYALAVGGLKALELTATVPGALELVSKLVPSLPKGFVIGMGNVLNEETARAAIEAGARFIASPIFRPSFIHLCHSQGVAAIPGALTPTEIRNAWEAGADFVNLFPVPSGGPCYLKELKSSMNDMRIMPAGNIHLDSVTSWIEAGATAVSIDATLLDSKAIATGNDDTVIEQTQRLLRTVRDARGVKQEAPRPTAMTGNHHPLRA